jgi:hypothetical protein
MYFAEHSVADALVLVSVAFFDPFTLARRDAY